MFKPVIRCVLGVLLLALTQTARADQFVLLPAKDTTLYQDPEGTLSNALGPTFYAGRTAQGLTRRTLIQFDLSPIPAGSVITSATLTLRMTRTRTGTNTVTLHRVSADWGTGTSNAGTPGGGGSISTPGDATWLHRFYPSVLWASQGGDFVSTASASTSVGAEAAYTWSAGGMITDIQAWVNNPGENFGWMVRGLESGSQTAKEFQSRESNTNAFRPTLRVVFTPPAGTGACCFADGRCTVALPADCAAQGGLYQGNGVTCQSVPCPLPTGACCLPSGFCEPMSEPDCTALAGQYRGDNIPCGAARCPVVLTPFVDPLPIPPVAQPVKGMPGGSAAYVLPIQQFSQQLHRDLNPTTVWGIAGTYPGPTIEAGVNQPITVTWVNDLRDEEGSYRTDHFLPVDTCLVGPMQFGPTPRTVIHLHGGHVPPEYDGDPYDTLMPGEMDMYTYPNIQPAAPLWYHDHAMGITRLNVYMGIAGFYFIRDAGENSLNLPSGSNEVPLVIQDRSFNPDGSLYYPAMWEDHFFGDTTLVNGKVWPFLNVKRGKYRFRILNGSNSRTYTLSLSNSAPFALIGSDQGLLSAPLLLTSITVSPSERADIVIDFSSYAAGSQLTLVNSATAPFPGGPGEGVVPNVMRFTVIGTVGHTADLPATLRPVVRIPESEARISRPFDMRLLPDPCHGSAWMINGLRYQDIVETPRLGSTEIWTFINRSPVMHPMHMHLVRFQVLDRQSFQVINDRVSPTGPRIPPPGPEAGWKDTVQANPSEITRVIARFETFTGDFPYHCHILEHEDNEMMRQMRVLPACPCDRNNSGTVDSGDFFGFVASFFVNNADFNGDGQTTSQDFFDFLTCFFQGC